MREFYKGDKVFWVDRYCHLTSIYEAEISDDTESEHNIYRLKVKGRKGIRSSREFMSHEAEGAARIAIAHLEKIKYDADVRIVRFQSMYLKGKSL